MKRWLSGSLLLGALCVIWTSQAQLGSETPPLPQNADAKPRKVRTFAKACPECGQVCISTNLVWTGSSNVERFGTVTFTCFNKACEDYNESFSEELRRPIKKSPPMVEVAH